jgi:enoyl-[acyl-carrier-protein] reductase (NADH)
MGVHDLLRTLHARNVTGTTLYGDSGYHSMGM